MSEPTGASAPPRVESWKGRSHPVWLYRFLRAAASPVVRFAFRTRVTGDRRIPKTGPVIIVSNHASNIDPVLVICSVGRPLFHLGKHTLFTTPFRRWFFMTLGGQIPVDRQRGGNQDAVDAAMRVLERGHAMAVYPEGTRSPTGKLHKGRTGVARLALASGATVYPVAVKGTYDVWPKGKKLPRLFRRTEILIGEPRVYRKDPDAANHPEKLRRVTDELMMDLADLLGERYDPRSATLIRPGADEPSPPNL